MNSVDAITALWPEDRLSHYILPGKDQTLVDLPEWVAKSPIAPWVRQEVRGDQMWKHQALALDAASRGENVALTTGTNTGKSLIPQISFLNGLMTNKESTYFIVLPLTALNADQMARWDSAFQTLGLPRKALIKIDQSMPPDYRLPAMKDARVVLITPHSLHGWFMSNVGDPRAERFLKNLRGVFLDEVQTYGEVIGANAANLLRRVSTLHHMLNPKQDIQWFAASGTLSRPKAFLKKLVSRDFTVIGSESDGSRQNQRTVFHLQADTYTQSRNECLDAVMAAAAKGSPGLILYFIDSRNGVEEAASVLRQHMGEDAVVAYSGKYSRARGGKESSVTGDFSGDLNERIRNGSVKVIVTTSALQAGINIQNANTIVNEGIPFSVSDFKQRLGRSGRGDSDAAILLVGDGARFAHFAADDKTGLTAYVEAEPEDPPLILDNRALGFISAQCLLAERESLGLEKTKIPPVVTWAKGTNELLRLARLPRRDLPPELQPLKAADPESPQTEFPLLNTGVQQATLMVDEEKSGRSVLLTDMSVDRALRECPPGGTFRYGLNHYFVAGWNHTSKKGWRVNLTPSQSRAVTQGNVEQQVIANLHTGSVIQNHFLSHPDGPQKGYIAEQNLQVMLKSTGLSGRFHTEAGIRSFKVQYRDVESETAGEVAVDEASSESKVHISKYFAQKIYMQTTGVVMHLPDAWFGHEARQVIASALVTSHMRMQGKTFIDPNRLENIGYETENVMLQHNAGDAAKGGAVAIMDRVQCGLRLTEGVFNDFSIYLEDAIREDREKLGDEGVKILQRALDWHASLVPYPLPSPAEFVQGNDFAVTPEGHALMFAIGSIVDRERGGVRTALRVVDYTHFEHPDTKEKIIAYKLQAPYVASDKRATAANFDHAGKLVTFKSSADIALSDTVATVSVEQVQAPLTHIRFSYAWVNKKTLEVTTPTEAQPVDAKTAVSPEPKMG